MSLSVGLGLFTGQIPPGSPRTFHEEYKEVVELCRLAEKAGFDSVWVSEHHGAADGYLPSLSVLLGAVAAVTERVQLGTGVDLAPFQSPLRFAEDYAVLDQLSGGRTVVGLALGWREEEFRAFGVPMKERVTRTVELVRILRQAWSMDRFTSEGLLGRFEAVAVTPKPAHPIPIWLGGYTDRAVARAGRLADGFLASRPTLPGLAKAVEVLDEAATQAGRDPSLLEIGVLINAFVMSQGILPAVVLEGVRHQMGTYAAWRQGLDTPGHPFAVPEFDRSSLEEMLIQGSPERVLEKMAPWVKEFGSRRLHLVIRLHYPGMTYQQAAPAVELFAEQVMPALRRLAG